MGVNGISGQTKGRGNSAALLNIAIHSAFIKPKLFYPIRNAHRSPGMCNPVIVALVARLLCAGRPAYVTGFIASAVINALNRVLITRPWPYMRKEARKISPPVWVYSYAAPAIIAIALISLVMTALYHRISKVELGRLAHPVRQTWLAGGKQFIIPTSA